MKLVINDHGEYDKKRRSFYEREPLILLVQAFYAGQTFPFLAWIRAMHISESTANRLIKKLQLILDEYGLVVTKAPIGLMEKRSISESSSGIFIAKRTILSCRSLNISFKKRF